MNFHLKGIERTVSQEYIYEGKILKLRVDKAKTENGKEVTREVVEHNGGVCIAALTDENELLFVKQFRYAYQEKLLELPAGKREKNENPLECGKRELKEETGVTGKGFLSLGQVYPTPGYCTEILHLYICRVDEIGESKPDEDEVIEVVKIPLERAVEMVINNEIPDAKTQIAVMKTYALVRSGRY